MALADVYNRTRAIIYGTGLGEKPAIRRAAANAAETTSGDVATFATLAGEGAKLKAGNVLSSHKPTSRANAFSLYVLGIASETITVINGYEGGAAIAADGDLDAELLEQNPLVMAHEIYDAIDDIIANMLWPDVYDIVSTTVAAPNLAYYQEAVAAEAEEITNAWQLIGSERVSVPFSSRPMEVSTSVASTGKLAEFGWIDGSTGYYTYRAKFTIADETDTELTRLIATGAAALCLGGSISQATIEATKKDNPEAAQMRQSVAGTLWRDFLTLRTQMSQELSGRLPNQIKIDRG